LSLKVVQKHGQLNVFKKTWYSSPDFIIKWTEKSGTSQTRACMIAPVCAYKYGHVQAYVCIYVSKWLRACAHILAGMIARMCGYTWANDCTHVCVYMSKWLRACAHIRAGMIALMCVYTWANDCACVHIFQACSHLRVHIRAGMIEHIWHAGLWGWRY
jgi:hypothetical protein